MTIIRVLVPDDNQGTEAIRTAIQYVEEVCELKKDVVEEVILFIPAKNLLKHTSLAVALGEKQSTRLHDGGTVSMSSGIPMRAETIKTLRWTSKNCIILAVYSDQKMLDKVDALSNLAGIIAIPHLPDALAEWKRTWSPSVHGEAVQVEPPLISDPIFEQALLSLTRSINLSHARLNPRDKEHVDRTLRILRIKGHTQDAKNIRSWAIKNRWDPKAADELEILSEKIRTLKSKPRIQRPDEAESIYQYWCSKASSTG